MLLGLHEITGVDGRFPRHLMSFRLKRRVFTELLQFRQRDLRRAERVSVPESLQCRAGTRDMHSGGVIHERIISCARYNARMDAPQPRLVIITGMSGAGKSSALRCFEDLGYCCIDNLPPSLIETFIHLYRQTPSAAVDIAIVCDVRSGELFSHFSKAVESLSSKEQQMDVLFLDSEDDVLVKRFKAARRVPPLGIGLRLEEAIMLERQRLDPFKGLATLTIDTSSLTTEQLRTRLLGLYTKGQGGSRLAITVLSFGFKYGVPADADFIFDTRFLRNPFYVEELRQLTGQNQAVREYVMQSDNAVAYAESLKEMLATFLPSYMQVNKYSAVIAMGCTGGKHRSVTFANLVTEHLQSKGMNVTCQHRDIDRL